MADAVRDRPAFSNPRRRSLLARFGRASEGTTAIEFAMVIGPFMALVFGAFELGMMLVMQNTLESSAQEAARTIRVGTFQSGSATAAAYKNAICSQLGWMTSDCQTNLYVDVRTFPSFAAVSGTLPITNGAFDPSKVSFQSTTACSIVLARAFYNYTLLAPDLSDVPHMAGGTVLLTSALAFRNEPYLGQTC